MLTQRLANIVFAMLVLLVAAYFTFEALRFEDNNLLGSSQLSSRFFPLTILTFIIVCALIVLGQHMLAGTFGRLQHEKVYGHWREALRGAMTFGVAVACFLIWIYFGFIPMALIVGPACAVVMGVRSIGLYIFLITSGFVIYLIFSRLLGVELN